MILGKCENLVSEVLQEQLTAMIITPQEYSYMYWSLRTIGCSDVMWHHNPIPQKLREETKIHFENALKDE